MVSTDHLIKANAVDLEQELAWFGAVIDASISDYFDPEKRLPGPETIPPPKLGKSPYASFVTDNKLRFEQRIALVLALVPHLRPRLLDVFFLRNQTIDRPFTEFGGEVIGGTFQPTGETLAFLLAADNLERRVALTRFLFDPGDLFTRAGVLSLHAARDAADHVPALQHRLVLAQEYVIRFTTGEPYRPAFGSGFPAHLVTTDLDWSDLVLDEHTRTQLDEVQRWLKHHPTLRNEWGMGKVMRPGFRSLFYGPPGTGKTLAACLLGKLAGRDVYRIDLSQIVSKWIGETEKNMARLFDLAQHKDWILFFDEADALFGKRSETKDSHDRYANQEVSYLLQRIERCHGIVILATNLKHNVDAAFMRRFESAVHFPMPGPAERLRLWRQTLPAPAVCRLGSDINLEHIAHRYALTGASIASIVRDACLLTLDGEPAPKPRSKQRALPTMTLRHLEAALHKDYRKEERSMG